MSGTVGKIRGHLIFRYQNEFYFVPEDCIGSPANCTEDEKAMIAEHVAKMMQDKNQQPRFIDFGFWLDPCDLVMRVFGRN